MQPRVLLSIALSGALLGVLLHPTSSAAQSSSAQAEQMFRDGKKLMGEKKFAEACAAFEASYNLDAAITTRINLADCREKNGQIATAWGLFLDTERETRGDAKLKGLNTTAKDRAAKLEPRLSYLIINVPDDSRVDGLAINRDGVPVDPLTWNRALPVDGGSYTVEGKAPGHEPWSTTVQVQAEHDKQSVDVPKFKAVTIEDTGNGNALLHDADHDARVSPRADGGMSGKRKAALGLGVVGVIGLGTGVVFEILGRGDHDDASAAPTMAAQDDLYDSANRKRAIAIGAAGVGVVCVGVAAYLWITGGSAERRDASALRVVPNVGPGTAGLGLTGAF